MFRMSMIDSIVDLWSPHTFSLLAGRPRKGKTTFIISMAKHIAFDRNMPVLLLSFNSKDYVVKRLLVNAYELETQVVYENEQGETELLDYTEYEEYYESSSFIKEKFKDEKTVERIIANDQRLRKVPFYLDCFETYEDYASMAWIGKIREDVARYKIKYVFVDSNYSRYEKFYGHSFLSSLRHLADELDCAIIATAFMSKGLEDRFPELSSMCMDIEDCRLTDMIMILHGQYHSNIAMVKVMKPDGSLICDFDLLFIRKYGKFVDSDNRLE